jgi:hypothetical protein
VLFVVYGDNACNGAVSCVLGDGGICGGAADDVWGPAGDTCFVRDGERHHPLPWDLFCLLLVALFQSNQEPTHVFDL